MILQALPLAALALTGCRAVYLPDAGGVSFTSAHSAGETSHAAAVQPLTFEPRKTDRITERLPPAMQRHLTGNAGGQSVLDVQDIAPQRASRLIYPHHMNELGLIATELDFDFMHAWGSGPGRAVPPAARNGINLIAVIPPSEEWLQSLFMEALGRAAENAALPASARTETSDPPPDIVPRWSTQPPHIFHGRLRLPAQDAPPNGLLLHLFSIGDHRFEESILRAMRERGWATLTVGPEYFLIRPPRRDHARGPVTDAEPPATDFDELMMSWAEAARLLSDWTLHHLGLSDDAPRVLLGCSLGAIAAPTVVQRLADAPDAVVLIGGGADMTLCRLGGLRVNIPTDVWLDASRCDPAHTAAALRHLPALMLDARFDAILPSRGAHLLHSAAGMPERWTYLTGHIGLFLLLPLERQRIVAWIERTLRGAELP